MIGVLRVLASHRLGLTVLGALGAAVLLGGTLPQSARLSPEQRVRWQTDWTTVSAWMEGLRLSDIYGSTWFQLLAVLAVLNLTAAVVLSGLSRWRLWRGELPPSHRLSGSGDLPPVEPPLGALRGEHGTIVRGRAGLFGLPLLHAGLLLVVAGAALTATGRFGAHLELTEGELFSGDRAKFTVSRGTEPAAFPGLLRLDRARVEFASGRYLRELSADVTFQTHRGEVRRAKVRANHPLELGAYRLYPDNGFGYSAVLDRLLPGGERRLMLVNFSVPREQWKGDWEVKRRELLRLPGAPPLRLDMALSGDPPRLALRARGGVEFDGVLSPGESADLEAFELRFRGISPWLGFYLAHEPARETVFAGTVLALAGFLLHMLFPFRRVCLRVDAAGWELRAWADRGDLRFGRWWRELEGQRRCRS